MVKVIAELTIALLLFADASTLRWRELRRNSVLPARLLLVGFPLRVRAGFEPRGLASVIFTLIAGEALEHEGGVRTSLDEIATWTVFLSVILHGVSARPLARKYGAQVAEEPVENLDPETPSEDLFPRFLATRPVRV